MAGAQDFIDKHIDKQLEDKFKWLELGLDKLENKINILENAIMQMKCVINSRSFRPVEDKRKLVPVNNLNYAVVKEWPSPSFRTEKQNKPR